MAKLYYTLVIREDGVWSPQFGAYDREDVAAEMEDYLDHGTRRKDAHIIHSGDRQADINAAVALWNIRRAES